MIYRSCALFLLLVVAQPGANAGIIDAYPNASLPTFGAYGPVGEVSRDNPALSISPRHNFATYFAQSFAAPPGLLQELTFNMRPGGPNMGIDFRVLIAETQEKANLFTPTRVVFSTPIFTLGAQDGVYGDLIVGPDITVNLGGLDLVDGVEYSWVLDTVMPTDGIEGYGQVGYRHPAQADIAGNSSVLVWDLDTMQANQPWINIDYIDLAYRITFLDGGISHPALPSLEELPTYHKVSEPAWSAGMCVFVLALLYSIGQHRHTNISKVSLPRLGVCSRLS